MSSVWSFVEGLKPAMVMVVVEVVLAGVNIFYKLAANDAMSLKVLVAYRYSFAAAFMVPLAFIFERKNMPKLTWVVIFQAFLCGLFGGTLAQNLYLESLTLTSATFVTAMANLTPAITFIMSITIGLEKLGLKTLGGAGKVVGTLIGISGAMVLTLYKGPHVDLLSTGIDFNYPSQHGGADVSSTNHSGSGGEVAASLLCVGACICYALWLIIQAKMCERYPSQYLCTAMMSVTASIQSIGFALVTEKDWKQWRLGWNIRLLTVAYSGIVASGLSVCLMGWCAHKRGPFFVSAFNPLMLLMVAIAGSLILEEKLHLGSVIGGVLIICGLYFVLWGKSRDIKPQLSSIILHNSSQIHS